MLLWGRGNFSVQVKRGPSSCRLARFGWVIYLSKISNRFFSFASRHDKISTPDAAIFRPQFTSSNVTCYTGGRNFSPFGSFRPVSAVRNPLRSRKTLKEALLMQTIPPENWWIECGVKYTKCRNQVIILSFVWVEDSAFVDQLTFIQYIFFSKRIWKSDMPTGRLTKLCRQLWKLNRTDWTITNRFWQMQVFFCTFVFCLSDDLSAESIMPACGWIIYVAIHKSLWRLMHNCII